jgi:subtilisin family serine protease
MVMMRNRIGSMLGAALRLVGCCTVAAHAGLGVPSQGELTSRALPGDAVVVDGRMAAAAGILARLEEPGNGAKVAAMRQQLAAIGMTPDDSFNIKSVKGLVYVKPDRKSGVTTLTADSLATHIKALQQTGLFSYVEPDWVVTLRQLPTDAGFTDGSLWGLRNTGQNGGTAGIDVNAVPAWSLTNGTPAVVVGVVDTGIRYTHQDLAGNMWINPDEIPGNGIDDDGNGYVDDVHGIDAITKSGNPMDDNNHGTHCAGTIAAVAGNAGQQVGVAYNARLMALKFANAAGKGALSNAIKCIDYGVTQGANILSNSWSGEEFSQALADTIEAANAAGVLFIASAGNTASDNDLVANYPSNSASGNVVAVTAIDRNGNLASFSSYGAGNVDLGAPGVSILSCTAASDTSYGSLDGTSMAAPYVAGVAALLKSLYPTASVMELKNRLLASASPLSSLSGRTVTGGTVNAHRALTITPDGQLEVEAFPAGGPPLRAGASTAFQVTVTDLLPVTGASVSAALGEGATVAFVDDGISPDRVAGDATYSATFMVPSGLSNVDLVVAAAAPGKTAVATTFSYQVVALANNDSFSTPAAVTGSSGRLIGTTNVGATGERGEPNHAGVSLPLASVWYRWLAPLSGPATVDTFGSDFDTTLAVYTGNTMAGLVEVAANDDDRGLQSRVTFNGVAGTTYAIAVDGVGGAQGNIELNVSSAQAYPEITVEQPAGTDLTNGAATIEFAASPVGASVTKAFTIRNSGTANLTGLAATTTGTHAGDFIAGPLGATSLAPGAITTVDVTFTPVALGLRVAALRLASNDADENPFEVSLSGGVSTTQEFPEIAVEQPLGTNLADADTTDFGRVAVGSKANLTFTIKNTGIANLTGVTITKDGPNATDFTVTANPAALVGGPDGTTSFTVRFAPSAAGIRTAALHLASNDPDENPFDIDLTGIGADLPEIAVEQPAGVEIPDGGRASFGAMLVSAWGASSSLTVTISNSGGSDLSGLEITKDGNNASEFTVSGPAATTVAGGGSTTFTVTFTPSEFGSRSRTATLQIWSNDADENPYDLDLFGEVFLAPDIVVEQPAGTVLTDGRAAIAFGNIEVGSTSGPITVTVRNTGTRSLNDLVLTKDGRNAGEFTVGNLGATSIAVGGSTTFTLTATPGAPGPRVAALHLASDDPDENPFDIELRVGAGTAQEFWRQRHFGSPANSSDGADLNDFERDGISNLLEFAFDLHPKQSSAGLLPQPQIIGNNLVISFIQAENVSGITYGAEWSEPLLPGSWFDVTDTGVAPQHIFSVPIGTKPRLFLRLKVSSP